MEIPEEGVGAELAGDEDMGVSAGGEDVEIPEEGDTAMEAVEAVD